MVLKNLKKQYFLEPFANSPLTAGIAGWIFEHEKESNKGPFHVIVADKQDVAIWLASTVQLNLFFQDFFEKVDEMRIRSNDLISIGTGRSSIIARYIHYSKKNKKLFIKLRDKRGNEMDEEWPLLNPLCISKVTDRSLKISLQKDAWKRFCNGLDLRRSAIDQILGIESFGNKNLFTSKIILVTRSIKKIRNYLADYTMYDEPLNKVVGADRNLIIKNCLDELLWIDGDELKREIKTSLINPLCSGVSKTELSKKLSAADSTEKLREVLTEIKEIIGCIKDDDRRNNFFGLFHKLKTKLNSLPPPFLDENVKYIFIDDPSLVLNNIKAYNKLAASGKTIVVVSDPKSLVTAFQETSCSDKQNNIMEDYETFLQGVQGVYNFQGEAEKLIAEAEIREYGDDDVWRRNISVLNFRLELKSVEPGAPLEKVMNLRRDFYHALSKSEDEKLKRLFYTYVLPVLDFVTSAPVFINDECRTLINKLMLDYFDELSEGNYFQYLSANMQALAQPKTISIIVKKAVNDIEKVRKKYFLAQLPNGYEIEYTGRLDREIVLKNAAVRNPAQTQRKAYLGATRSNFRQLVDDCLNLRDGGILFMGTPDECRYIEYRLQQAFHIPDCIMKTAFFPDDLVLGVTVERLFKPAVSRVKEDIGNIGTNDIFNYLNSIHITPKGTLTRSVLASTPSDRKIKAGLLYFKNTKEMFYPLEGGWFFVVPAHTTEVEESPLSELELDDTFLFISDFAATLKRSIQEALSAYNRGAYQIIYEWKSLMTQLLEIYTSSNDLAAALLQENSNNRTDNLRNMKMNIQRWLNEHSDIWTPERENLMLIYTLASRHGLFDNQKISGRIDLVRGHVAYAKVIREKFRNEVKATLQAVIKSKASLLKSFHIDFQGKQMEVCPLRVINNHTEGLNIDSSYIYKLRSSAE